MTRRSLIVSLALYVAVCGAGIVSSGCGGGSDSPKGAPEPGAAPAAAADARSVDVAADRGWQDSGISVRPQQKFRLRYTSGQITDKDVAIADAAGSDYVCGDPGCCEPLPDERRAALLARIAGEVFLVGNGGEYTAPAGGTIFFRVNDCDDGLADNTGRLQVEYVPQ